MKRLILLLVLVFGISQAGFCDVTYSAKSTVKQDNNSAEVIRLDVRPIVDLTNQGGIGPDVRPTPAYVAPLILPSNEDKPALNFNLNNVKNVKKGAILPDENVNRTITSVVQYFPYSYDKVFSHLLGIVEASELEVVSYDSNTGKIFANYKKEKPIYITVSKYNNMSVMVKITPADGIYNIPGTVTDKIYSDLNKSLSAK
ncbi:MAG: DUF3568 domain-containing protein [Candidatus Gastranaerophilales bacterium]|nr:DUF3568 domain-containing protein [Candidatus Gastranaerophilales bacterium]